MLSHTDAMHSCMLVVCFACDQRNIHVRHAFAFAVDLLSSNSVGHCDRDVCSAALLSGLRDVTVA
jgi:hypothetical protein